MLSGTGLATPARPNIVILLADDIGYGDLSCYGGKHARTPNLDRLAAQGLRFIDASATASVCTPARRALLTGTYSSRQIPGSQIMRGTDPASILPGTPTLPSLLRSAGYHTGFVGKWHLGLGPAPDGPDWNGEIRPGPLEIGFDYAFFFPATADRTPCVYIENHRGVGLDPRDPIVVNYDHKVGREPTGRENPELLRRKVYIGHDQTIVGGVSRIGWMGGGKTALWNDETIADTFATKAIGFIDSDHRGGPFFLYLATSNIHVPRLPNSRFSGRSPSGNRGDSIEELDDTVGRVLDALDRIGATGNTLFIFSSDNGGKLDKDYEEVYLYDYSPNGPLRAEKGTLFEGGHRVPMIVRWPGHVPAGLLTDRLIGLVDLPASLASLAGSPIPDGAAADSINLLPALLGQPGARGRDHLLIQGNIIKGNADGRLALREHNWKYIPASSTQPEQLYDLATDLTEQHNLAREQPAKAMELARLFRTLRQNTERSLLPRASLCLAMGQPFSTGE